MTIGEKYFILLSKVAAIQQQIDELKPYWDNERDFVNKVRERFDELEKFYQLSNLRGTKTMAFC